MGAIDVLACECDSILLAAVAMYLSTDDAFGALGSGILAARPSDSSSRSNLPPLSVQHARHTLPAACFPSCRCQRLSLW